MNRIKKSIPFLIYMLIWSLYILFAWFYQHPGQMIEISLFVFYLLLPALAFIISLLYGQSGHRSIYFMTLFFGMMELLGYHLSYIHITLTEFEKLLIPSIELMLYGMIPSFIGVMIGQYITKSRYL